MSEEEAKLDLTPEEQEELNKYFEKYGSPTPDPKFNVHTFLNMVANAKDTTKLGFLKDEELGVMTHTVRANKVASLIASEIIDDPELSEYFAKKSEITTATSLSRGGFLDKLAVVTKKEIADVTPPERKENKSWFKKKEPDTSSMSAN